MCPVYNPREPNKRLKPILVSCELENCLFHEGAAPGYKDQILCSHPHKHNHLLGQCPLYQLDWMKQINRLQKRP